MIDNLLQSISNNSNDIIANADVVHESVPVREAFRGNDEGAAELRAHTAFREERPQLPDAFDASFRRPRAADLVNEAAEFAPIGDTTIFPFRTIAYLTITANDGTHWRGSAFLASPSTLVTAGHNVFIPEHGGWVQSIDVALGRNGSDFPYGEVTCTKFFTVRGWSDTKDPNFDYGAIVLPHPLGTTIGHLGLHEPADGELTQGIHITGYANREGQQFFGDGHIRSQNALRLYYDDTTAAGQSGAAVRFENSDFAIGIHGYDSGNLNSGVRINPTVHAQIRAWLV